MGEKFNPFSGSPKTPEKTIGIHGEFKEDVSRENEGAKIGIHGEPVSAISEKSVGDKIDIHGDITKGIEGGLK